MKSSILPLHTTEAIHQALHLLQVGHPVAFPTDTVYGIGVPALNAEAIKRLYAIKHRPTTIAIPVLLADPTDIGMVASDLPTMASKLAQCYWPGALTLVLPAAAHLPPELLAHGTSVAVRVPDHDWIREMIRALGQPLAATSANIHGHPECTTALDVAEQLGDHLDLILDGGIAQGGIPSTLVDCTNATPRVLRQGGVYIHLCDEA